MAFSPNVITYCIYFKNNVHSLFSPVDGLQLDTFPSVKVHSGCDFTRKNIFRIQWTEVFFLGEGQQSASRDLNKLTGELAKAFCQTLMPHLSKLSSDGLSFIGLRVNLDPDSVRHSLYICHLLVMCKITDSQLFIGVFSRVRAKLLVLVLLLGG